MILGYAATEVISRRYKTTVHATANDTKLELFMFVSLLAITQPLAMLATAKLGAWLAPDYKGILADLPWWGMVGLLLVCDDMTQYWWHRLSHSHQTSSSLFLKSSHCHYRTESSATEYYFP